VGLSAGVVYFYKTFLIQFKSCELKFNKPVTYTASFPLKKMKRSKFPLTLKMSTEIEQVPSAHEGRENDSCRAVHRYPY
jgi:hypothetical protein